MLTDERMNLAQHWKRSTLPMISDWKTKHSDSIITINYDNVDRP